MANDEWGFLFEVAVTIVFVWAMLIAKKHQSIRARLSRLAEAYFHDLLEARAALLFLKCEKVSCRCSSLQDADNVIKEAEEGIRAIEPVVYALRWAERNTNKDIPSDRRKHRTEKRKWNKLLYTMPGYNDKLIAEFARLYPDNDPLEDE